MLCVFKIITVDVGLTLYTSLIAAIEDRVESNNSR